MLLTSHVTMFSHDLKYIGALPEYHFMCLDLNVPLCMQEKCDYLDMGSQFFLLLHRFEVPG